MLAEVYDTEREMENEPTCHVCEGDGGFDVSGDPEEYDHWEECAECQGTGEIQNI